MTAVHPMTAIRTLCRKGYTRAQVYAHLKQAARKTVRFADGRRYPYVCGGAL